MVVKFKNPPNIFNILFERFNNVILSFFSWFCEARFPVLESLKGKPPPLGYINVVAFKDSPQPLVELDQDLIHFLASGIYHFSFDKDLQRVLEDPPLRVNTSFRIA